MDRADIRKAALNRFCQQGFHGTTMRQLAGDLGVTAGSLYHHHPTKEGLLADLIETILMHNLGELRGVLSATDPDPMTRLRAAIRYHVYSHCLEQPESFVTQYDYRALPADERIRADELRLEYEGEFASLLTELMDAGTLPQQNLVLATKAIMGAGLNVAHWFHLDGTLSPEEVSDWYVDAYVSLLLRRDVA